MDVEDDTAIMEDEDDDKSVFLYVLENLPPEYILYHKENFDRFYCNDYQKNMYYRDIEYWQRSSKGLKGMDLDDVKHYPFNELAIFTDDIHKQYTFETNFNGRFLRGSIKVDSDDKNIIIKTWDLHYPPRRRMRLQVVRLHNELTFLMDALKRKPHSCLPKLIGYSIDKRLAVIYDIKTDLTLRKLLDTCDDFSWKKRLSSAIEVAKMMCYFHEDDITIGSIDSLNLIFDEDGVLKLCDFGLTVKKKIIDEDHDPYDYVTGKHYKYHFEKLYFENGDGWTLCSDIFAFGFLLLELILFSTRLPSRYMDMKVLPSDKPMPDKFGRIDTSIIEDVELGVNLRGLAWKCMQENPSNRPKAKQCYNDLISFMHKADPVL